jgi:hypothetical protein
LRPSMHAGFEGNAKAGSSSGSGVGSSGSGFAGFGGGGGESKVERAEAKWDVVVDCKS